MLTRLKIRNFKRFDEVDVELGKAVVFIGPNNSGKTTALQALALWEAGLSQWNSKRSGKASPGKRPGVTINRLDLISIPVPVANLLWRDLHTRSMEQANGKAKRTQNIRIDIEVEGVTADTNWDCGLEFDYSNEESFFCRARRLPGFENVKISDAKFSEIPEQATRVRVAYLPPMSGLAAIEPKWEPGRVNVLLGEGRTAEVLRNLCHQVCERPGQAEWHDLVERIRSLFSVELLPPVYLPARGEIRMEYKEHGVTLDLSASGRGLQQTLLLLAHLYANPGTVLLLDEPDAHLEILRQRQIYALLSEVASATGSQIIAASHSEVVLNEAAGRDLVIAFVGRPHPISDRGSQVLKSLTEIGFDQYYQAEQAGWVLYLEDTTDLAILQAFAKTLGHEAQEFLARPFVHYVTTNQPQKARDHFFGLREAKSDLVGVALFDRLKRKLQRNASLKEMMWRRREIENYLCMEEVLLSYAAGESAEDLFGLAEREHRERVMKQSIRQVEEALQTFEKPGPWTPDVKASDDFLDPLFRMYFKKLGMKLRMRKGSYHELAALVPREKIDPEVNEKLDAIVAVARRARPRIL